MSLPPPSPPPEDIPSSSSSSINEREAVAIGLALTLSLPLFCVCIALAYEKRWSAAPRAPTAPSRRRMRPLPAALSRRASSAQRSLSAKFPNAMLCGGESAAQSHATNACSAACQDALSATECGNDVDGGSGGAADRPVDERKHHDGDGGPLAGRQGLSRDSATAAAHASGAPATAAESPAARTSMLGFRRVLFRCSRRTSTTPTDDPQRMRSSQPARKSERIRNRKASLHAGHLTARDLCGEKEGPGRRRDRRAAEATSSSEIREATEQSGSSMT